MVLVVLATCAVFVGLVYLILQPRLIRPKLAHLNLHADSRQKNLDSLLKMMALLFFAWAIARAVFSDSFILVINGGTFNGKDYKQSDYFHSILRWGHNLATVTLPMATFFKSRLFKNIAVYISLPFALLVLYNFNGFMSYYTSEGGRGVVVSQQFRQFFFAFELFLAISIPVLIIICDRHVFNFADKGEVLRFVCALPFIAIRACPVNVPQSIFGYTSVSYSALTAGNIFWILLIFSEIFVLNRLFRFKPYRERYMLCMFLALAAFVEYNSLFMMGFSFRRLPFQLCNLGTYFFLIVLLTKSKKFFNFVFLANITGAIIAIVSPDNEGGGAASFWAFHYFIEHTLVLVIPLMCNLLRIFPRLDKTSALKHLTIGFAIYFAFCLVFGTVLNGITDITNQPQVNYFYIFDMSLVASTLPFLQPLTRGFLLFDRFIIYPFFQLAVFAVFWLMCVFLYFGLQKLYAIVDDHFELRLARIDLVEKLTNKKSNAQREYLD